MSQNSISFFQNFLTSGARLQDRAILRRIKVLNTFELTFLIASPFLALFYFYAGVHILFYSCILAGLMSFLVILALRITKNPKLCGNIAMLIFWATLMTIRWNTGSVGANGLILLTWVWNAVLILMAIFLAGYLWGTIWSCLVFLETAFAVYLYQTGYQFANLIPGDVSPIYSLGAYLLGLLVVLLIAFLFEKQCQEAQEREEDRARALQDSRKYVEDLLLRSPVPTFVIDRQHRIVQWNRACHQLTGITPGEIIGKKGWDGFSLNDVGSLADNILDDPESVKEHYNHSTISATDSGSFAIETDLPHLSGGSKVVLNAAPILGLDGTVKGAIQTIQPIEGNIGNRTMGLANLVKGADERYPCYEIDGDGKITDWNHACEELLGYKASQMVGTNPLPILSKPYRPVFRELAARAMQGEVNEEKEWKYYDAEGQPVYVLARIIPGLRTSEMNRGCLVFNTDITGLKLRAKKLERYAMESKEKYKRLAGEYQLLKQNIASFIRKKEG